jgi:hypothetical protein
MKNLYFIRHEIKKKIEGNQVKMDAVLDTISKTGDNIQSSLRDLMESTR